MIGRILAHYRITAALGAGGMGEVYRATDTKLGRDVALKVLPAEMARDPDRLARFQREARAVAALNHPNIVTIFSVEQSEGTHFLTMELIDGQPLDRLISANGLSIERIVEIAGALAEALAAAHEKGILHRDLKPANVMVTNEGRVKVLDFGLAKDVRADVCDGATLSSAGRTQAGVVMGTPSYMSPEQVSGRAVDHRTDIFSLGVVLHEMATGRRPFEGTSSAELVSCILRDSPPAVTDVRPDLPADLARVIRRCLEKDPRYRIQTARDVGNEFRELARLASSPSGFVASAPRAVSAPGSGAARADEGFWVAVLPFKYTGSNDDLKALAEGLSEEAVTGLSRFSYLRVIARGSTAKYSSEAGDVRAIGKELGARYVMEGSLRQAGTKLRLAVQLVDTASGAHLWAENYERTFSPETAFELQDDLVSRIVSTVADMNGILPRSMGEAVLRSFGYFEIFTPEELAAGRSGLEAAVRKAPGYADAWAMLSYLCAQDYVHGYELQADALETAASAARRAVELAPSNHLAYFSLAQALSFQKDYDSFRDAAERAVALNPMDGNSVAHLGELLTYAGSMERGMQLAGQAKRLNPNHPGSYWYADFYNAYSQADYHSALGFALKVKLRGNPLAPMMIAAACGQLGDRDGGAKAVSELVKFRPELPALMRRQVAKVWNPEYGERFLDGLRKAGMVIPESDPAAAGAETASSTTKAESGAARVAEGLWVAVLPFRWTSGEADLEALAEGLTEDATSGLSRFPYLQVIAHNSAMAFRGRAADIRGVGRELGARYVLEGSVRKRGGAVRVSAQLLDAASGAQLWAEAYDREISNASPFEIQDDLTDHIVTTVADGHGVLVRSMAAHTRDRNTEDLSASELVLRYYAFIQRVDPKEHCLLRAGLEHALEREPSHAVAWACLSDLYLWEYLDRWNPREKPMERARDAAWRSVKLDPACQMGWKQVAECHFFSRDFSAFRGAAERAISLNPRDGTTSALMAILIAYSGEWERGVALAQRAMELNRHHPGWYHMAVVHHQYRKGEYEAALQTAKKINMPEFHWAQLMTAAACGMLGRREEARVAIELLSKYNSIFLDLNNVRDDIEKWLTDKDVVDQLMQGLQKAGLCFGPSASSASMVALDPTSEGRSAAATALDSADSQKIQRDSGQVRNDEGFWVAVLPFKYVGSNADLKALAAGLFEEIVTGLSRFSYLRVIARASTAKFSSESGDARAIGKELGARYVMEGTLRQAGTKLRISVQLVDATSGAHLWAESYERAFSPETTFELQDDLVSRIVSTVADAYGVLPRRIGDAIRGTDPARWSPYEALVHFFGYHQRLTPADHLVARQGLERAVEIAPRNADSWAALSLVYSHEYGHGFNPRPNPLERALDAAKRAVDLAPGNNLAHQALSTVLLFRREIVASLHEAEHAIALNPSDAGSTADMGANIAFAGDWDRGCSLIERAMDLNPLHPVWYRGMLSFKEYWKSNYRGAVEEAVKTNAPDVFWMQIVLAAAHGQLGDQEAATRALRALDAQIPTFPAKARDIIGTWFLPDKVEHLFEGLRKAGMVTRNGANVAMPIPSPTASTSVTASGTTRPEEGFWVAVLPFKYTGSNADLKALAEGLSEEALTGLSRFSYLRVIARGSTAKYSSESGDVRTIGKELGARYIMEGTLRQLGAKLRLAVQLVDTVSGAHLWAETYERAFQPEAVFDVQDDLVPRIVSTVADQDGILPLSMVEALHTKSDDQLTPHEAVVRSFSFFKRFTAEEHAKVRQILEAAVRKSPDHGDCWAMLSHLYCNEYWSGFNARMDPLGRGLDAARRAVDAAPSNHLSYWALALPLFFRRENHEFRVAAERCIELNRMDGSTVAFMGALMAYSGDWDHGCAIAEPASALNPNHAGWHRVLPFYNAFRKGEYREALTAALRLNAPASSSFIAARAAAYGQLGEREAAEKAVKELVAVDPTFATSGRDFYSRFLPVKLVDCLMDGLRKAGLDVPGWP